jgi:DNA repair protein RecO (recombination protein O)
MRWTDEAIVLKAKEFSETSFIVTVFSKNLGIHKGLLRNRRTSVGDIVQATWTSRLPDQLGIWGMETIESCAAAIVHNRNKLDCFQVFCEILCEALFERMVCSEVYERSIKLILSMREQTNNWIINFLFFEFALLPRLGIVMDFSDLVNATEKDPLKFVSPKTGKVVTQSRGIQYEQKLLKFPNFLLKTQIDAADVTKQELTEAFAITHHFVFKGNLKSDTNEPLQTLHHNLIKNLINSTIN